MATTIGTSFTYISQWASTNYDFGFRYSRLTPPTDYTGKVRVYIQAKRARSNTFTGPFGSYAVTKLINGTDAAVDLAEGGYT